MNPQPSVLETDALPVELVPSDVSRLSDPMVVGRPEHVENHQERSVRGEVTASPNARTTMVP
ncbi:hypothetical protein NOCA2420042 [metagenome]|uniref:Uncharacterized protein n=1 Tax=metagenome TaxID=256318 RepID=A0A2P2C646_9ZZZZ